MRLSSPKGGRNYSFSLYSPDNLNVVLVIRDGHAGTDTYTGTKLDWVDNGGGTVPGSCNQ